jgi:two-component system LytT family sensor kinase
MSQNYPQDWPPELNISSFFLPPRPNWKLETVELLGKITAACRLFQDGLTPAATLNLARGVYASANYAAVAISNRQTTLAFVGPSQHAEPPHNDRVCPAVRLCLESGKFQTCRRGPETSLLSNCWEELSNSEDAENSLQWLIVVPLENENEIIGTLMVYASEAYPLQAQDIELARWIGTETSLNLELGRLKGSAGQLAEAELKALRAQISPHFLFNTLNTIAALVRIDAEQARDLIVDFASFFRRTLKQHGEFVTLAEELDYVSHYLRFESVRFAKNLKVKYDIAPGTESVVVPVLSVQPLVENAINHGLAPKIGGGSIRIRARTVDFGDVLVEVSDDGVGIEEEALARVLRPEHSTGLGMALSNIDSRLQKLFGPDYGLKLESTPGKGTKVSFRVSRVRKS